MPNKNLQDLHLHWNLKATKKLRDIDWHGEIIKSDDFIDRIDRSRAIIRDLVLQHTPESAEIFGIAVEDSPNNLALGIALILEGITQAIIPLETTKQQQEKLCERYNVTILATSRNLADHQEWKSMGKVFDNIQFYNRAGKHKNNPEANSINQKSETKDTSCLSLLLGTTSGTTSQRPEIVRGDYDWFMCMAEESTWSPYFLIDRPLVGSCMQNWSSRLQKLLLILRGKTFVARHRDLSFEQQPLIDSCDGALIAPNPLRSWIAQGNMKHLPDGFLLISGSDRVTTDLRQDISNIKNVALGISYATSQTGPITWLPPEALLEEEDSVGWPLKHVNLRLIENSKNLNKNGKIFQEAIIRTPRTTLNPGDYLHISESGQIIFGGRSSDVFLFNSILVSPLEIEDVLNQHAGVKECAAFGAVSNRFGSVPMAAYTIKTGWDSKHIDQELDTLCREHLGKVRPRKLVKMDILPRGRTGKILRRELSSIHALNL